MEPGKRSSAVEHALHTGGVAGSIPAASTIPYELLARRRGPIPKASCCVYLIAVDQGTTKIGMSNDPTRRLASLRTSNFEKLSLEHHWRLRSRDQAAALEAALHAQFRWAKIRREWFSVPARWVKSAGEALLAGDADRATAMSAALCETQKGERELDALCRQGKERLSAIENNNLAAAQSKAAKRANDSYRVAMDLGLEVEDWERRFLGAA